MWYASSMVKLSRRVAMAERRMPRPTRSNAIQTKVRNLTCADCVDETGKLLELSDLRVVGPTTKVNPAAAVPARIALCGQLANRGIIYRANPKQTPVANPRGPSECKNAQPTPWRECLTALSTSSGAG